MGGFTVAAYHPTITVCLFYFFLELIDATVKPPTYDLLGTMKIRSVNGGSLYWEVNLYDVHSNWFFQTRSLLGGFSLFGGFTVQ